MWQMKNIYWIPVKWHEITAAEKEEDPTLEDYDNYLDCEMPEDGEEILITSKNGYVSTDICIIDDGAYGLKSGSSWTDDVKAWAKYPEPYEEARL